MRSADKHDTKTESSGVLFAADGNSAQFKIEGGPYVFEAAPTFGGGSITLNKLGPDDATFIPVMTALTASGQSPRLDLTSGTYRVSLAGSTAPSLAWRVQRIPDVG